MGKSVFLHEHLQVLLPDHLFRRQRHPLLAERAEYLVAPDLELVRFGIGLRFRFLLGHTASFYSFSSS